MTKIYDMIKVPSVAEYVEAFDAIRNRLLGNHLRLLVEQYFADDRSVTSGKLARLAEISGGHIVVNRLYGRMGRWLCEEIGFHPEVEPDTPHRWWAMLSKGWNSDSGFIWRMRSQVAEALEVLGWVSPDSVETRQDSNDGEQIFVEGSTRRFMATARDRSRHARARCIVQHGTRCSVCDMSFEEVYGEEAKGFIHVHHTLPLSEATETREVDPVEDLRPVCPNCHAVIHLGGRHRSIEEVRQMLRRSLGHEQSHGVM